MSELSAAAKAAAKWKARTSLEQFSNQHERCLESQLNRAIGQARDTLEIERAKHDAARTAPSTGPDAWTASGWLASQALGSTLAECLLRGPLMAEMVDGVVNSPGRELTPPLADGEHHRLDLGTLKAIGTLSPFEGPQLLRRLLRDGSTVDKLARALWPCLVELATAEAATGSELQGKFLQDGAKLLKYSDLSTFFGGLEGVIGAPDPKVPEAIKREHAAGMAPDADRHFTTDNYEITSTSAIEFRFVDDPDNVPEQGWPQEQKCVG